MTALRPEFERALRLFARICDAMTREGFASPVLVGGGAVELYTVSAIGTGDMDVVTAAQDEFERVLKSFGFTKPGGLGHTPLGWVHPDLQLGFEVVGSMLLDGMAERRRVRLVDMKPDGSASLIAVEDLIADRMGQYASGTAPEMLEQARILFGLYRDADLEYLERRLRYETAGDYGIADLQI